MATYRITDIQLDLLHLKAIELANSISTSYPPTSFDIAYKLYCIEYRFATIIAGVAQNKKQILLTCSTDYQAVHLYAAAAAWTRPSNSNWTWQDLPTLHYGLARTSEIKAFVVALNDLLKVRSVDLGVQFDREQALRATICARKLFPL